VYSSSIIMSIRIGIYAQRDHIQEHLDQKANGDGRCFRGARGGGRYHLRSLISDEKRRGTITNLYRYSDLSVEAIAQQVDSDLAAVEGVVDDLAKEEALEVMLDQSMTRVEKVMSTVVIALDCSMTPKDAAALMAENAVGSAIVTKDGKPFGIVTQSDIVRWVGKWPKLVETKLADVASVPLIAVGRGTSVEEAARIMIENKIHKLPVVDGEKLLGIATITDLAVFLSPSRRPGLAQSVFRAISRGK
jgi:CBS domain-containing protein